MRRVSLFFLCWSLILLLSACQFARPGRVVHNRFSEYNSEEMVGSLKLPAGTELPVEDTYYKIPAIAKKIEPAESIYPPGSDLAKRAQKP